MENISENIKSAYDKVTRAPLLVYEVFCNFFGRDKVDLCGPTIESITPHLKDIEKGLMPGIRDICLLVWFPEVTVTNDAGASITIWDLYVKVPINSDGYSIGDFKMLRSTYTAQQLHSHYMHSHACTINYPDITQFSGVCLGKGPIRGTLYYLQSNFDLVKWEMFCLELSIYVSTESTSATPYLYLTSVSNNGKVLSPGHYCSSGWKGHSDFVRKVMRILAEHIIYRENLSFIYNNDVYKIGMSYEKLILYITRVLVGICNAGSFSEVLDCNIDVNYLKNMGILCKAVYRDNQLLGEGVETSSYWDVIDSTVLIFKDKMVPFKLIEDNRGECELLIVQPALVDMLVGEIIKSINYENGNIARETPSDTSKVRVYL